MAPEIWARNPHNYVRECVEVGFINFAWDYGILLKKGIDPYKFSDLYLGKTKPWKSLIIAGDGAVEIDDTHPPERPLGMYPVWEYGSDYDLLIKTIESGEYEKIVICKVPSSGSRIIKKFFVELSEVQEENPDCTIHIHGSYNFFVMYGLEFKSTDFDPRNAAGMGELMLPSGKRINADYCSTESLWLRLLGYAPVDMKVPRNRCMFNIKANDWAAKNYKLTVNFETRKSKFHKTPDFDFPRTVIPTRASNKPFTLGTNRVLRSDRFLCNLCSLQSHCTYFREGSVCIVPGSEPAELAHFFKTRDSDTIIEGLGTLLATQSHRLNHAIAAEEAKNELHPETRKLINDLFDRGVKLAKLVNPSLNGTANINLTQNTAIVGGTPQQLMSSILDELERRGIPRRDVTPDMIMRIINQPDTLKQKAIEVAIAEKTAAADEVEE